MVVNEVLISVLLAGFGAQTVKLIILWFKHKKLHWHDLVLTGGMPSSHSAFVVALATSIYIVEGSSPLFALSLVMAMIVIRDAFGVRRSVGNEGKAIERLFKLHKIDSKVHYAMGHTPKQVLVGSIVGFVVALLTHYLIILL